VENANLGMEFDMGDICRGVPETTGRRSAHYGTSDGPRLIGIQMSRTESQTTLAMKKQK